jgi:hypothetical protein
LDERDTCGSAADADKREVESAVAHGRSHFERTGLPEQHLDLGMLHAKRRDQLRERQRAHRLGLHRPEHHGAAQAATHLVDGLPRRSGGRERPPRFGQERCAGVRQGDLVGGPLEQPAVELALQPAHRGRDGRLDDVQPSGGAREAAFLGDGDKRLQLAQFHVYRIER